MCEFSNLNCRENVVHTSIALESSMARMVLILHVSTADVQGHRRPHEEKHSCRRYGEIDSLIDADSESPAQCEWPYLTVPL